MGVALSCAEFIQPITSNKREFSMVSRLFF